MLQNQVITISDITSADGTYILPEVKLGQPPIGRKSTLEWPQQGKSSIFDWNAWRNKLLLLEYRGKFARELDITFPPYMGYILKP